MSTQARRDGETLLVDNVDVKRAARTLLQMMRSTDWQPPKDINQAMETVAKMAGFPSLYAVAAQSTSAASEAELGPRAPLGGEIRITIGGTGASGTLPPESADGSLLRADVVAVGPIKYSPLNARAPRREPNVSVLVGGARENRFELAARGVSLPDAGTPSRVLDMTSYETITLIRSLDSKAWDSSDPSLAFHSMEPGASSTSSSELVNFIVRHPNMNIQLLFPHETLAAQFFATWVYQDGSPAIPRYTVTDLTSETVRTVETVRSVDIAPDSRLGGRRLGAVSLPPHLLAMRMDLRDPDASLTTNSGQTKIVAALKEANKEAKATASSNPMWVRLRFECDGDNYETVLMPGDNLAAYTDAQVGLGKLLAVELSTMLTHGSSNVTVQEKLRLTPEQWMSFVKTADVATFYRECTESGYVDIAHSMTIALRDASTSLHSTRGSVSTQAPDSTLSTLRRKPRP